MALQMSGAGRSPTRAFCSSSGSKWVGAKEREFRSAGRVLAGHRLAGRVSPPPGSLSEGAGRVDERPPDGARDLGGASENLGRPEVFLTGVRGMARR
jgi:hypothetical protein